MLAAINAGQGVGLMNQYSFAKTVCSSPELVEMMPLPSVDCLLRVNEHRYNPATEDFCLMLNRLMHKTTKVNQTNIGLSNGFEKSALSFL